MYLNMIAKSSYYVIMLLFYYLPLNEYEEGGELVIVACAGSMS